MMEKETTSTSPQSVPNSSSVTKSSSGGMFKQLQIIIGVAIVIATLFTAWTEPGLLPGSLSERLSNALTSQRSTPQAGSPTTTARPNLRIGIVAGHSGNDSGAVCADALGGYREVDINLSVASKAREILVAEGYDVDLLAEFDPRLSDYHAIALVSIHADSCEYINDQGSGFMNLDREILTQNPDVIANGIASGILCFIRNEDINATQVP